MSHYRYPTWDLGKDGKVVWEEGWEVVYGVDDPKMIVHEKAAYCPNALISALQVCFLFF